MSRIVKVIFKVLLFVLAACSPDSRYRVLSTIFDGVPDPNATVVSNDTISNEQSGLMNIGVNTSSSINLHYPFQEKECNSCHLPNSMGQLSQEQPDLCYTCHDDFSNTYKVVHGPVAGGYCTTCHEPHKSKNKALLKREGQDLCLHCHVPADVLVNETHSELDGMNCTECHNPHGGSDRFMFY